MVIAGARVLVDTPARTPLPYGLLSVASPVTDGDAVHWQGGLRFETDPCGAASIYTDSCAATGAGTKAATDTWLTHGASPFTVYTMPVCAPIGFDAASYQARVVGALTSGEARAVEREFWTGEHGVFPHLAANAAVSGSAFDASVLEQTAAVTVTGSPVSVTDGMALLEAQLATCYGNEGVIHVPPIAVAHLMGRGLLKVDGARLRSPMGHLVAAGAGYPGTAPDGTTPASNTTYMYATGAVSIRRSPIDVTSSYEQAVSTAKNDVFLVAERTYVIGWDCCHFAQPVTVVGGTLVT